MIVKNCVSSTCTCFNTDFTGNAINFFIYTFVLAKGYVRDLPSFCPIPIISFVTTWRNETFWSFWKVNGFQHSFQGCAACSPHLAPNVVNVFVRLVLLHWPDVSKVDQKELGHSAHQLVSHVMQVEVSVDYLLCTERKKLSPSIAWQLDERTSSLPCSSDRAHQIRSRFSPLL